MLSSNLALIEGHYEGLARFRDVFDFDVHVGKIRTVLRVGIGQATERRRPRSMPDSTL
jgi:hypothetical protein